VKAWFSETLEKRPPPVRLKKPPAGREENVFWVFGGLRWIISGRTGHHLLLDHPRILLGEHTRRTDCQGSIEYPDDQLIVGDGPRGQLVT
jgi:hypothetical protein